MLHGCIIIFCNQGNPLGYSVGSLALCRSQTIRYLLHNFTGGLSGQGIQISSPHSELGYNAATNCQYVMKNCLYFRVNVEVH